MMGAIRTNKNMRGILGATLHRESKNALKEVYLCTDLNDGKDKLHANMEKNTSVKGSSKPRRKIDVFQN
jgi:hypothetical protein